MGNQQGKDTMDTYSPEWMAGLIVGEGCFTLATNRLRQSKTGWLRITPIFSMSMTDIGVMEKVAESFRHHGLPVYLRDIEAKNTKGVGRAALRIHLNGQVRVLRVAEFFIPHLDGNKKQAAEAVRDFCIHRLDRGYRGVSDEDIDCVERVRAANATNGVRNHSVSDLRDYKMGRAKARMI